MDKQVHLTASEYSELLQYKLQVLEQNYEENSSWGCVIDELKADIDELKTEIKAIDKIVVDLI